MRWGGLLVCAIDGTTMALPDSPRNLAAHGKQAGNHGGSGYPLLRLVALAARGTRTVIDAVFRPASCGELDCTRRLRRSLHAGMLVLLDRNFDAAALVGQLAATNAALLVRLRSNRKLPVLRRYRDGSYLSQVGAVRVRVAAIVDHGRADVSWSPARTSARRGQYRPVPIWGSCRRRGR